MIVRVRRGGAVEGDHDTAGDLLVLTGIGDGGQVAGHGQRDCLGDFVIAISCRNPEVQGVGVDTELGLERGVGGGGINQGHEIGIAGR